MKILKPNINIETFFNTLKGSSSSLLMLDYDGTLAPFVTKRDSAYPYKGVWEQVIQLLHQHKTRVVIISGRMIKSLKLVMPEGPLPEIWGCHGFERWIPEKGYIPLNASSDAIQGLDDAESNVRAFLTDERFERKNASVVVHWRGVPIDVQNMIHNRTLDSWTRLLEKYPLEILEFDGGIEIRALGKHKGDVVDELLSEMPSNTCSAYLGDDRTDEDAFLAMAGRGLSVIVKEKINKTAADLQITPPNELQWFLDSWSSAVKRRDAGGTVTQGWKI